VARIPLGDDKRIVDAYGRLCGVDSSSGIGRGEAVDVTSEVTSREGDPSSVCEVDGSTGYGDGGGVG
jgi:hypothetical protein